MTARKSGSVPKRTPHPPALLRLASEYARGDKTATEVRQEAGGDPDLAPLLPRCLGVFTLPHELLEAAGTGPFDPELTFDEPPAITREGLLRNLRLAREGKLDAEALSDWATDGMSWQIAAPPEDEVVVELCGELMMGPDAAERVVRDEGSYTRFVWHLENTPAVVAERCSLALAVAERRDELESRARDLVSGDGDEDGFRSWVRRAFSELLDAVPTLDDDLLDAFHGIRGRDDDSEALVRFLDCLALHGDPPTCADEGGVF